MTEARSNRSLSERFPALFDLRLTRRQKHIPFVQQAADADCAAACLTSVIRYYGNEVSLSEVRDVVGASRHGTDALSLLNSARYLNLRGRGIQVTEPGDLKYLPAGSVLHWRFNHFVVLERAIRTGAWIVDPAVGRRFASNDEINRALTGVALSFEPTEDFRPGKASTKPVRRYLDQILRERDLLTRVLVTSLLVQLFALAFPLLTSLIVDRVVPRGDLDLLQVLALGISGLIGFKILANLIRSFLLLHIRTRLDAKMTLDFLDHMVDLPYPFFQQRSAGDLMMRLQSNTTIREFLTSGALSALLDGSMVSFYLVILLVADVRIGILAALFGVANVVLFLLTRQRQRDLMSSALRVQADSQNYQVQMLAGMETMKLGGAEHRAVEHWSNLFVKELNVSLERGRLDAVIDAALDALRTSAPLAILLAGALFVSRGELSLGTMLALNALAIGFLTPLSTLIRTSLQLQLMGSYLDRIGDVLDTKREQEGVDTKRLDDLEGTIELADVTFSYSPLATPAVRDVSCTVPAGQMIAIVGGSGSGKSTLAALIAGLYVPDQGRIFFDDEPLDELDLKWLRTQLGFVAQQPYLFGLTMRENIALYDPSMAFSRVVEAAEKACIHDDVAAMPMGYDALVADGGASLSGGQCQRLALARALASRPRVLILDEATSALDAVTEREIQRRVAALRITRVVIAHRLSTIREADLILVMKDGKIVERGDHASLLSLGGRYHELVAAQMEADQSTLTTTPSQANAILQ